MPGNIKVEPTTINVFKGVDTHEICFLTTISWSESHSHPLAPGRMCSLW